MFKKVRGQRIKDLPHQVKTAHCFRASKASSHFLKEGKFMMFKQLRYIHRARLGLVPLNVYKHGTGPVDRRCRRCDNGSRGGDETLPHVLNHCMRYSTTYKARHNALINRLKRLLVFVDCLG